MIYYYDAYGRSTGQSNPQTARATVTEYNAQGQVDRTADLAGNSTFYEYHATGAGAGQLKKITHQDGAYTSYVYDLHGRVTEQTGSADYPVRYTYDATNGWMTEMKTYRDTTGADALNGTAGNASLTTWAYDAATGLLTSKTDAASKATSYTYWTGTTLLKERLWARFVSGATRVTTTYNYDGAGQLTGTTYNDSTPSVTRTYDRAGREATRTDAAGLTTITRTAAGFPTSEAITGTGVLTGWTLNRTVDTFGRYSGVDGVWSTAGLAANNNVITATYGYDGTTGRLDTVTNNARPVAFSYATDSDQPYKRQFKDNANAVLFEQEYGYDEAGRLNTALTRDVSPATVHAAYYYQYDNRNRRTQAVREDGIQWNYGYDLRGQVTSAKMKTGADFLAGRQYEYEYDAIGNRTTAKSGGDTAGANLRSVSYTRNNLNQYSAITNPLTFDVNGLATNTGTNANGITVITDPVYPHYVDSIQPGTNGVTARWRKQMTANSADNSKAVWETVNVKEGGTLKSTGTVRLPPVNQAPAYDNDGNLTADGTWTYTWDAENRLTALEMPALPQGTGAPPVRQRVSFSYDGLSRRISKLVSYYDGTLWATLGTWFYTWDGWNCVLRCYDDLTVLNWDQSYIWGPDLSGTFQGAGGVGGLLIEYQNLGENTTARRLVGYDGNGNVTTLADGANGQLWALYEYDAFGNETRHHNAVGTHADDNPFRFSTKPVDDETGLVYYGYRYYTPALGRWISRDPIGEEGGLNLNGFVFNSPQDYVDPFGQSAFQLAYNIVEKWEGNCGHFAVLVHFSLTGTYAGEAHVYQKVQWQPDISDCPGYVPKRADAIEQSILANSGNGTYFEAWPGNVGGGVTQSPLSPAASDTVGVYQPTADGGIDRNNPGYICTYGKIVVKLKAVVYAGPIPSNHSPGKVRASGDLPSSATAGSVGKRLSNNLQRTITARWDCCNGVSKTKVQTE